MKIYYFKTKEEADKYGFIFPSSKFKDFAVIVVAHKKKVVSTVVGKSGNRMFSLWCKDKPEDIVYYIDRAIMELSRIYPELRNRN